MKVPIPLNSSLCTDSHKNEIKNPQTGNDLFSKNQSYLINSHLTNPKKKIISADGYITTRGDILTINRGSEKTQIFNGDTLIADVLSLGIEDTVFIDKDDAVIDEGYLWTVSKSLLGYIVERIDLQTQETTTIQIKRDAQLSSVAEVRFVRNTHKVIARLQDCSILINNYPYVDDGNNLEVNYADEDMAQYLTNFNGEFTAAEVNGKIIFGYNNPFGVFFRESKPSKVVQISGNANGWSLADYMLENNIPQNAPYVINIAVDDNVIIGAGGNGYAMDFVTGILDPSIYTINLRVGHDAIITGRGGNAADPEYGIASTSGTSAILTASNINIIGDGTIQGGGGGGGGAVVQIYSSLRINVWGSGGAGFPVGIGRFDNNGTISKGGDSYDITINNISFGYSGAGGDPGKPGLPGYYSSTTYNIYAPGAGGNAIVLIAPALYANNGVTLLGGVVTI